MALEPITLADIKHRASLSYCGNMEAHRELRKERRDNLLARTVDMLRARAIADNDPIMEALADLLDDEWEGRQGT